MPQNGAARVAQADEVAVAEFVEVFFALFALIFISRGISFFNVDIYLFLFINLK